MRSTPLRAMELLLNLHPLNVSIKGKAALTDHCLRAGQIQVVKGTGLPASLDQTAGDVWSQVGGPG